MRPIWTCQKGGSLVVVMALFSSIFVGISILHQETFGQLREVKKFEMKTQAKWIAVSEVERVRTQLTQGKEISQKRRSFPAGPYIGSSKIRIIRALNSHMEFEAEAQVKNPKNKNEVSQNLQVTLVSKNGLWKIEQWQE